MKNLLLVLLLLAGLANNTQAQHRSTYGISLAYARTELISSNKSYNPVGHSAYQAGLMADFYLADVFSIHPELLYTMQYYDTNDVTGAQNRDITYLNLPVLARYHVGGSDGGLFFEAGPQLNLPLTVKNEDGDDVKSQTNTFSLDYVVGLGYVLKPGIGLGVRYDGGATNVFKNYATSGASSADQLISNANLKTSTFLFLLSYTFGGR